MNHKITIASALILIGIVYLISENSRQEVPSEQSTIDSLDTQAEPFVTQELSPDTPVSDKTLKGIDAAPQIKASGEGQHQDEKPLQLTQESKPKRFNEQGVDEDWAYKTSYQIHDFLRTHNELMHLDIKDVNCRETTCQIEIFLYDNDIIKTAQLIGEKFKSSDAWKGYAYYFNSSPEDGLIRVEIDRPAK